MESIFGSMYAYVWGDLCWYYYDRYVLSGRWSNSQKWVVWSNTWQQILCRIFSRINRRRCHKCSQRTRKTWTSSDACIRNRTESIQASDLWEVGSIGSKSQTLLSLWIVPKLLNHPLVWQRWENSDQLSELTIALSSTCIARRTICIFTVTLSWTYSSACNTSSCPAPQAGTHAQITNFCHSGYWWS